MTGCERVLHRLEQGPATAAELYQLGVILHSRVSDLRRQGHNILCERVDGDGAAGYLYTLLPPLERGARESGDPGLPVRAGLAPDAGSSPGWPHDPGDDAAPLHPDQLSMEVAA